MTDPVWIHVKIKKKTQNTKAFLTKWLPLELWAGEGGGEVQGYNCFNKNHFALQEIFFKILSQFFIRTVAQ